MAFAEIRNFSSRVEKYFTRTLRSLVKYSFNTRREISYLQAAVKCSIYYINTNEIPNHFTLIVFWCERRDLLWSHSNGDIFTREDNMLFSHVKISSFRAKANLVFYWCLYNKFLSHCSQISAGDHMQIIGDPIGAVEVKVLTSQTPTYKLCRVWREYRTQALAFCIFLSVKAGLDAICS